MKTIFNEITAQLETVPGLKWIDEEKGQMNFENPPILFPAALVSISLPNTQNFSALQQQAQAQIRIQLCFDFGGNTNSLTPALNRVKSLAYYDVVDSVYKALQGFSTDYFNALERRNFVQILRPDVYKTVALTFTTDFIQD